jgi:subtilase family serine protease
VVKLTFTGLQRAYNVQQQYTNIQSIVTSLLGKLNSNLFSLSLLETWSSNAETAKSSPALVSHLKGTITSCEFVIAGINAKVKQSANLSVSDKVKVLWNSDVMKAFESDLDSQIQALTLLLHIVQLSVLVSKVAEAPYTDLRQYKHCTTTAKVRRTRVADYS